MCSNDLFNRVGCNERMYTSEQSIRLERVSNVCQSGVTGAFNAFDAFVKSLYYQQMIDSVSTLKYLKGSTPTRFRQFSSRLACPLAVSAARASTAEVREHSYLRSGDS